jgi:hypothetical protein
MQAACEKEICIASCNLYILLRRVKTNDFQA